MYQEISFAVQIFCAADAMSLRNPESVVLSLSCSLRLLLALYAGLLVMLPLADFLLDSRLCAASLETTQCAVQSLILFYDYARHFFYPPFSPVPPAPPEKTILSRLQLADGFLCAITISKKHKSNYMRPGPFCKEVFMKAARRGRALPPPVPFRCPQGSCRRPGPCSDVRRRLRRLPLRCP